MKFFKYNGIGNDFILFDGVKNRIKVDTKFCKKICDRNFGVGADGVLYVLPSKKADLKMTIVNADGSIAEMCGNGIRCVAKYAYDHKLVKKKKFDIETLKGILAADVKLDSKKKVSSVKIDMGKPILDCKKIPVKTKTKKMIDSSVTVNKIKLDCSAVSMGNPHFIVFSKLKESQIDELGPILESHKMFPRKTNVEFAKVEKNQIKVRVYERGAAWTLACGTGACATTVAAALRGLVPFDKPVTVCLPGGKLKITVDGNLERVLMEGPAEFVYEGNLE